MICSLIPYILLSLSLIANLIGFLVLTHETQTRELRNRKKLDERLQDLERKIRAASEPRAEPDLAQSTARSGLNMSKRTQAMRMFRRHENVSHIAAALGVARREVELLIRVHKLAAAQGVNWLKPHTLDAQFCTLNVQ